MALRAFHCNPALGGFGDETETTTTASTGGLRRVSFSCASSNKKKPSSSAVHATAFEPRPAANSSSESLLANNSGGGDAFAQIIKELVDNAVDACNDLTHQNCYNGNKKNPGSDALKKVTVVIDKVESDDKFVKAEYYAKCDPDHDSSSAAGVFTNHRELLRVVVSDNGCGMEDVEKCVSVFSSSKNQDDFISCSGGAVTINDTTASKNSQQPAVLGTAGRYGLGLTLCILHAQRLVPNSCVIIESTVQNSATMTKFKFIVDTERDAVVCLHREDCVKKEISVSGTSVSLLLPGGMVALKAWPRLAEYFARYQLSLGLKCSLEVLAPSLSRVPLLIRPSFATVDLYQNHVRKEQVDGLSKECSCQINTTPNQLYNNVTLTQEQQNATEDDSSYTDDIFDLSESQVTGPSPSRVSLVNKSEHDHKGDIAKTHGIGFNVDLEDIFESSASHAQPNKRCLENRQYEAKKKDSNRRQRRDLMRKAVGVYLKKTIDVINVAHSKQIIRRNITNTAAHLTSYPTVEVDVIVSGIDDIMNENTPAYGDFALSGNDADYSKARIMLIRMVNGIPLLDSAEVSACGVVRCLQHKTLWNSFGLEISPLTTQSLPGVIEKTCYSIPETLNVPTFLVSDSVHVAPFFTKNNAHCLYNDEDNNFSPSDSEYDSSSVDDHAVPYKANKRRRTSSLETTLKPAGLRLGTILIVVHLNAHSSQLPLPTLSKGRLPMNDKAINIALHTALTDCLRSLQKTNPKLFLAPSQLKKTEREIIFVSSFASALSSLILNSNSTRTKTKCLSSLGIVPIDSVHAERRNATETQTELTSFIEASVRKSLKIYDEDREKDAIKKRVVSNAKKAATKNQDSLNMFHSENGNDDSSSIGTTDYDFDDFLNETKSAIKCECPDFEGNCVMSTVTTNEEEEMKSTFSSESFSPKAASQELETASSSSELLEYDHW